MKVHEAIYTEIKKYAIPVLKKYLTNQEDQEDVLALVYMKYHLNSTKIDSVKLKSWIRKVTQNAAIDLLKKQKKDVLNHSVDFNKIENIYTETFLENKHIKTLSEVLQQNKMTLKESDQELLQKYITESRKIRQVAIKKGISYSTLRKRIYRLKKEIQAEYNKQHGMIASHAIVGAKLHENILNFIKKFKKALETNSLEKMKLYFRECEIPPKIPNIKINKVLDYEIRLLDKHKYELFVPYRNSNNEMSGFTTIFEIYNENSIKIVEFPKPPSKIFEVELDKNIGDIIMQTKKDGTLKMKREEIMEFIKGKGKIKEIYNRDKSEE
jgi:RNA polymerase sigma factor (sigma-70 family)